MKHCSQTLVRPSVKSTLRLESIRPRTDHTVLRVGETPQQIRPKDEGWVVKRFEGEEGNLLSLL